MEKYFPKDSEWILKINSEDYIVIKRSSECRFYSDDVLIEVVSGRRFLILEDSFEYAAYPELTNSIKRIQIAPIGYIIDSIGAPCDKGGAELFFEKVDAVHVKVYVMTLERTVVYSCIILISELLEWNKMLDCLFLKRSEMFQ